MPGVSGVLVVTNARVYYTTRAAPGILHALLGGKYQHNSGASRREDAKLRLKSSWLFETGSELSPSPGRGGSHCSKSDSWLGN